jgi:hypothetical protein
MRDSWSDVSDRYLAQLYREHPNPTRAQIRDAYPFGEREYWPYKAWCKRVRAWRLARAQGLAAPLSAQDAGRLGRKARPVTPDPLQASLLAVLLLLGACATEPTPTQYPRVVTVCRESSPGRLTCQLEVCTYVPADHRHYCQGEPRP